jgi:hypothetical protein
LDFDRVFRTSVCPSCGKDVRVCKNCKFYSPGAHWDCRETISEPVREKDTVNFCEYFVLAKNGLGTTDTKNKIDNRAAFDKLFDS